MVLPSFRRPDGLKGSDDPERDYTMFPRKKKPFDKVAKLLKEMPWLWAAQQDWRDTDTITVMTASSKQYLDWEIASNPMEGKSICYAHVVWDLGEHMIKVEFEGVHKSWFDVMYELCEQRVEINRIEHFVSVNGNDIRVDRPPKHQSFQMMYIDHNRFPYRHNRHR